MTQVDVCDLRNMSYDEDAVGDKCYGTSRPVRYIEYIMAGGGSHWWHYRVYVKYDKASEIYVSDGNAIIDATGEHPCGDLYMRSDWDGGEYIKEINSQTDLEEANAEVKNKYIIDFMGDDDRWDEDDFGYRCFSVKGEDVYMFNKYN
jgi:hypothetical protein